MSSVWYTSDLHIGHRFVALLRGFDDVAEHDRHLGKLWDSTVEPTDQVFLLGDLAVGGEGPALAWLSRRPGVKHLIAGNHDAVHPMHRGAVKALPRWSAHFDSIQPFARRRLGGREYLLSHFPYFSWGDGPTRPSARYEQYRLPDLGMPLLHGHTHGTERGHGHMFHVGIDAWAALVPQETVMAWLMGLPDSRKDVSDDSSAGGARRGVDRAPRGHGGRLRVEGDGMCGQPSAAPAPRHGTQVRFGS